MLVIIILLVHIVINTSVATLNVLIAARAYRAPSGPTCRHARRVSPLATWRGRAARHRGEQWKL